MFHRMLLAFSLAMLSLSAAAENWPSRPIRFVVAAPGGSSLDIIARTVGENLKERLGQPVIVENVPGASGTIASATVARAAPDGHTLLMSYNGPLAYTQYLTTLAYDPQKDLVPVIQTSSQPNVLVVSARLPVKSVTELVALAKSQPGKLNYASVGNGSSSHLTTELFKSMTGAYVVHIPYNGAPPAALSVATGETHMLFSVPSVVMPHLRSGKLRALAVTSATRFPLLPDLPTVAESGLPKFESLTWNGIAVPAGTPSSVVQRLNREVDAILKLGDVKNRLNQAGLEPAGGTPEQFKALIEAEARKWAGIIRRTGAKLD
ncbi:tripartite tricarboxylate transporter substrate binding protein [Noviherbaspirillum sp.]|uniref:Bug family tripartite tricarboxylate transporter substrate binding protein n=1 Tax=Noviherbaspirillum sp. TaxID=1926288 RepID=UPI002D3508BF|nr:tripartite tricarboxylate transporter substrate binding protein [Noviherbaspirillum sp.]HZW20464.1 tripartite tricarboxylate transporter substrate binding protein [Noviherbaspirillum sp.]